MVKVGKRGPKILMTVSAITIAAPVFLRIKPIRLLCISLLTLLPYCADWHSAAFDTRLHLSLLRLILGNGKVSLGSR